MRDFLSFIKEGVSQEREHDSLDNGIWSSMVSKSPILLEGVFKQIMMDIEVVRSITNVDKVYLAGDLLTTRYTDTSELDVYIIVEKNWITPVSYERLMKFAKSRDGRFVFKTQHPLKYYIEVIEDDSESDRFVDNFSSVYDLLKQKWVKSEVRPSSGVKDRVSVFLGRVSAAGLDSDARIDWRFFLDVGKDELPALKSEVQSKAYEAYRDMSKENDLVRNAFKKYSYGNPPTVEEIEKLYDKDKIPATAVSKMVLQYYLNEYVKRIEDRMLEGKDTTDNELPPDGDTLNRSDPFPNENVQESRGILGFGEFIVEKGLRPLYKPMGTAGKRKTGVSRGTSTEAKSLRMTRKMDDKNKIVVNNGVMHGDVLANEMKKRDFGCVPITSSQVDDISVKYGLDPLTPKNPFRRLGKTEGMAIVKGGGGVFLVKNKMLDGIGGGVKK